ncbi:MAG: helix-turn-helix domain-containing protein [Nitrospira sp. CR2.1]|nr:helix-turn-helix domain-containing protein [Nitrospira sp. CR2.1]
MNHTISQNPHLADPPGLAVRPRLVSIQDCSVYMGLSVHTLYTMVSQRRIPFVKVGRLVKFDLALLDAWIAKKTVMPITSHRP